MFTCANVTLWPKLANSVWQTRRHHAAHGLGLRMDAWGKKHKMMEWNRARTTQEVEDRKRHGWSDQDVKAQLEGDSLTSGLWPLSQRGEGKWMMSDDLPTSKSHPTHPPCESSLSSSVWDVGKWSLLTYRWMLGCVCVLLLPPEKCLPPHSTVQPRGIASSYEICSHQASKPLYSTVR